MCDYFLFGTLHLSDDMIGSAGTCPLVYGHPASEVWDGKCLLTVSSIGSADQVEECQKF
jgi:hypothetical protein